MSTFVSVNHKSLLGYEALDNGLRCHFLNPLSGSEQTVILAINEEQIAKWVKGIPIQYALANISSDMRELFTSGINTKEFSKLFSAVC